MFEDDQILVACLGASDDDTDNLAETMHYAHLFASAPAILEQNQKANDLIERIDSLIEEAMGEWYAVQALYQPIRMLELGLIRDAIAEYNSANKDMPDEKDTPF
jgi:hypothetical protein